MFDGPLKFHRPEHLTPLAAAALQFACPAFLDKATLEAYYPDIAELYPKTDERAAAVKQMVLDTAINMGFETNDFDIEPQKRRFAGDMTLGRGSYYGVCRYESGEEDGAVANELIAEFPSGPVIPGSGTSELGRLPLCLASNQGSHNHSCLKLTRLSSFEIDIRMSFHRVNTATL
jgi:hypothetical protein